jgi:D-glycero-D-manno-heptose 1,7-bisphosphate phosphatase
MNSDARKAVFLDRDGVINHDPGDYTTSLSEFTILPGVVETLKKWSDEGFAIIVITNQGGLAKERYSLADFKEIDDYMSDIFQNADIDFLETYYCPHHDAISHCLCRKPKPGMIEKALARHNIDPGSSVFIGDKWRDVEAGEAAGVRGIKIDVNADLRSLKLQG